MTSDDDAGADGIAVREVKDENTLKDPRKDANRVVLVK